MKIAVVSLFVAVFLFTVMPAVAGDIGRYQLASIGSTMSPSVLILDTKEGHLWMWGGGKKGEEGVSMVLVYLGKVRPGKKMGDVIERFAQ